MAYESLANITDFLAGFTRLPFDRDAAARFLKLRKQGVRIGSWTGGGADAPVKIRGERGKVACSDQRPINIG